MDELNCNGWIVGGTGPADIVLDTNGQPMLTSSSSTTSMGQALPWRLNYNGDVGDQSSQSLCTRDLLCWSFQIARGMNYLASRKVRLSIIHSDAPGVSVRIRLSLSSFLNPFFSDLSSKPSINSNFSKISFDWSKNGGY